MLQTVRLAICNVLLLGVWGGIREGRWEGMGEGVCWGVWSGGCGGMWGGVEWVGGGVMGSVERG